MSNIDYKYKYMINYSIAKPRDIDLRSTIEQQSCLQNSKSNYKSKYYKYKKKYLKTLSEMEAGNPMFTNIVKSPYNDPAKITQEQWNKLEKAYEHMVKLEENNQKSINDWNTKWKQIKSSVKKIMKFKPYRKDKDKDKELDQYTIFISSARKILNKANIRLQKTPEQLQKEKEEAELKRLKSKEEKIEKERKREMMREEKVKKRDMMREEKVKKYKEHSQRKATRHAIRKEELKKQDEELKKQDEELKKQDESKKEIITLPKQQ